MDTSASEILKSKIVSDEAGDVFCRRTNFGKLRQVVQTVVVQSIQNTVHCGFYNPKVNQHSGIVQPVSLQEHHNPVVMTMKTFAPPLEVPEIMCGRDGFFYC